MAGQPRTDKHGTADVRHHRRMAVIGRFVANYGFGADSTPATANDVLVGAVITRLAVLDLI
nr:hypothetical protein [Kibdelosporangium sp. MJ126-NF4]CTQ91239.1 hypothetical protein [Kibdelosporangium sp. MJ126-NF4]